MEWISIIGPIAVYALTALANKYKIPFHPFGGGDPAPKPADPATPAPQPTPAAPSQPVTPATPVAPADSLAALLTQLNSILFAVKIGGGTLGAELKAAAPAIRHVLDQIDPPVKA